jgi:hypothetical protein
MLQALVKLAPQLRTSNGQSVQGRALTIYRLITVLSEYLKLALPKKCAVSLFDYDNREQ